MNPWRRTLTERLVELTDDELKNAMQEIRTTDTTGRPLLGGILWRLASEIADLMQTKPENTTSIVAQAIIVTVA